MLIMSTYSFTSVRYKVGKYLNIVVRKKNYKIIYKSKKEAFSTTIL